MKKRVRNSLIVIVVLVVVLGLGFGIWKIFFVPKPLKIKDLENMHITTTRGTTSGDWHFAVVTLPRAYLGRVHDNRNAFDPDDTIDVALRVYLKCVQGAVPPNVQAGDTLEITYDGGQTLLIYCPAITENTDLYLASDGSTYYNKDLTKLAWSPDSVKPLIIKDLEDAHISTTRSSKAEGWYFQFGSSDTYGWIWDNTNLYVSDWNASEPLSLYIVIEGPDDTIAIQAGDTLEITYDGGQTLTIYLPAITMGAPTSIDLFIATDGSTYYDERLTQLAQSTPPKPDEEVKNE